MGIEGLWKYISDKYPYIIENTDIKSYKGQKIAIDISCIFHSIIVGPVSNYLDNCDLIHDIKYDNEDSILYNSF